MPLFALKSTYLPSLLIGSLLISVSACTSMSFKNMFSDYAEKQQNIRSMQLNGDFKAAAAKIEIPQANQNNYTLTLLEKARLNYLANDWNQSREDFALVAGRLEEDAAKAKLRISQGVENVTALISSDNAITYAIPAYEQTMLHSYQALNYLFLGQLDGALVEVRRANLVQENALKQHQQDINKSEEKVDKSVLKASYPSMSAMIGNIKNGFQNAYTFYLSGILYEAAMQPNDAYIDYKRALDIYPDNQYIQQDVLRLAYQLNMVDDLQRFSEKYGPYKPVNKKDYGELVLLLEQGIISAKKEISLDLPIFSGGKNPRFFSFALPVYQDTLVDYPSAKINVAGQNYESEPITRLQSLASKQLQDDLSSLVTRQALRLIAKEKLRSTMSKEGGDLGNVLAIIYNISSEHADTRSWLSLPDEMQIMRLPLPAGKQTINVNIGGKVESIELNIKSGHISLVNLTSIGDFRSHNVTQL